MEYLVLNSASEDIEDFITPLVDLLQNGIDDGASMGYLESTPRAVLESFWASELAVVRAGKGKLLYARQNRKIVGTVLLAFESMPNGAHRAQVRKLIVHTESRGQGIAKQLLNLLEMEARISGKRLLILDTETESGAEYLYQKLGWEKIGVIPLHSSAPNGVLASTTLFFKQLD